IRREMEPAHGDQAHGLGAAGHNHVGEAGHDALWRQGDSLRPEEQNRLMVIAEQVTGSPARSEATRATLFPCSASGLAQPRITSSISPGSRPGTRPTISLITAAAMSSGRVLRSVPRGALPTA